MNLNNLVPGPGVNNWFTDFCGNALYTDNTALRDFLNTKQYGGNWVSCQIGVNRPPTANAGPDQTVTSGARVTLNGTGSTDPDDGIQTYAWIQTAGTPVTLVNPAGPQPMFRTPTFTSGSQTLTFQLTVTDGANQQSTDTCTIIVLPYRSDTVNQSPAANAGSDLTTQPGKPVTLDGSATYDPDNNIQSYSWEQIGGPIVTLTNPNSPVASFTAPLLEWGSLTLTFKLKVTDSGGLSSEDTCIITVTTNDMPGTDLKLETHGTTVNLTWDQVAGAKGYAVLYAPYPAGTPIQEISVDKANSFSAVLQSGAAYFAAVKYYDNQGNWGISDIEFFDMPGVLPTPEVTVKTGKYKFTLSWPLVEGATGYKLYYSVFPDPILTHVMDLGNKNSVSGNLPPGSAYFIAVQAYNANGNSKLCAKQEVIIPTDLSTPELTIKTENKKVSLSWTGVAGADGYRLYYAPFPQASPIVFADMGKKTSFYAELPPGSAYYVSVQAYNDKGSSHFSKVESFSIAPVLSAPKLTVTKQGNDVHLSWSKVENAAGYLLYYLWHEPGNPVGVFEIGNQTALSLHLPPGTEFYVSVQAYDATGKSALSNLESFAVPAQP